MSDEHYSDAALAKQAEVERKKAAGQEITVSDMRGILQPRDPRQSAYGACPTQLFGSTSDGRQFYFRARHGDWTLSVTHAGEDPLSVYPSWSGEDSTGGYMHADDVDTLVTKHLGDGWTAA